MDRYWKKYDRCNLSLYIDGSYVAAIIQNDLNCAIITLKNQQLKVRRVGFWKSKILLEDFFGKRHATLYRIGAFTQNYRLEYLGVEYTILKDQNRCSVKSADAVLLEYKIDGRSINSKVLSTQEIHPIIDCTIIFIIYPDLSISETSLPGPTLINK